jgi:hypothetical protein
MAKLTTNGHFQQLFVCLPEGNYRDSSIPLIKPSWPGELAPNLSNVKSLASTNEIPIFPGKNNEKKQGSITQRNRHIPNGS